MDVVISWTPAVLYSTYLISYRKKGDADWIIPGLDNPTINYSYELLNLELGTKYEVRITATCCEGSTDVYTDFTTPCEDVESVTIIGYGGTVSVSWPAVSWAISYNVEYKPVASSTYIPVSGSPTTSTTLIFALPLGGEYDIKVSVNCNVGTSTGIIDQYIASCPPINSLVTTSV